VVLALRAAGFVTSAAGLGWFFTIRKFIFSPFTVTDALNVSAFANAHAAPISV
jgi:hypothetical protein